MYFLLTNQSHFCILFDSVSASETFRLSFLVTFNHAWLWWVESHALQHSSWFKSQFFLIHILCNFSIFLSIINVIQLALILLMLFRIGTFILHYFSSSILVKIFFNFRIPNSFICIIFFLWFPSESSLSFKKLSSFMFPIFNVCNKKISIDNRIFKGIDSLVV